ncbi:phage tail protein [Pseudomonas aeruginosa]|nr:phage tail protein [Pseudomonas aeruginosa]MCT0160571.1 phage tail protein [Pseudomonas aeruginosa]MCT0173172.1 phage tail protein [Pseudomonas aeruginosa]MCT0178913.1 phage tail protein [Pseudomonas aeruginosa]MCT0190524.1 phage tail protein [Pseudomonas aeruginosa]
MADVRPTKLQNDGNGYGSLREFADGDTVPVALGGTGAATAAGARSSLFDPRLQNFSLLLGGADQLPFQTGPNSWSQTPLTSIGRAMIAASTQANALSYIGGVPKSLSSNRTVSDPNSVPDECGFYGIGVGPYSNLPPGIDALNPIGSMLYHHPYDVSTAVQMLIPRTLDFMYFRRKAVGTWQPWVRMLSDNQLVGTVSVDGANAPNGAIMQQNGTTATNVGTSLRFADGTQIVYARLRLDFSAVDILTRQYTFPMSFFSPPNVTATLIQGQQADINPLQFQQLGPVLVAAITVSSCNVRVMRPTYVSGSWASGNFIECSVIASGRWR